MSSSANRQLGDLSESATSHPDIQDLAREEEFKLVQRVFLATGASSGLTVLFAAVERQHDMSAAICVRASEILAAQVGGRVCLVDANLRAPSMHRRFGRDVTHGFGDAMSAQGATFDVAPQQVADNLWLLPSGSAVADPSIVFAPDRMRFLFDALRKRFEYVLISAPPLAECAESIRLSQLTNGVVLVVEAHKTRRERARSVKDSLDRARVPLLGIVLNNRTYPIPNALYHRL